MSIRKPLILFPLAALLLFAGCAEPPPLRVLWPVPPEKPRLEWIGTYASEDDFQKSALKKSADAFLGSSGLSTFRSPYGVAVDPAGKVYVSDLHGHNVKVFDFARKTINFYFKESPVRFPRGLAIDPQGRLYVVDGSKKRVLVFAPPAEQPLFTFGGPEYFTGPTFIEVNPRLARVYVADSQGQRIQVFDLQGKHLFTIGDSEEEGAAKFFFPQGLTFDAEDNLYVADTMNAQIQVLTADGAPLRKFGQRGDHFSHFEAPKDLAFDGDGNLWVVDNRRPSIYTYTPDGDVLLVTGSDERTNNKLGFINPVSIHIDGGDRIYITDMINKRFSVWQYLTAEYLAEHPITDRDLRQVEGAVNRSAALRAEAERQKRAAAEGGK